MANSKTIRIEIVYALPERTHLISLELHSGTTIQQAVEISGLLQKCPDIDLARNKVGIFSKMKNLNTVLSDGDRVEIYRELRMDPKEARRRRVERNKGLSAED